MKNKGHITPFVAIVATLALAFLMILLKTQVNSSILIRKQFDRLKSRLQAEASIERTLAAFQKNISVAKEEFAWPDLPRTVVEYGAEVTRNEAIIESFVEGEIAIPVYNSTPIEVTVQCAEEAIYDIKLLAPSGEVLFGELQWMGSGEWSVDSSEIYDPVTDTGLGYGNYMLVIENPFLDSLDVSIATEFVAEREIELTAGGISLRIAVVNGRSEGNSFIYR